MISSFGLTREPDIARVWTWFEYQLALLEEARSSVLRRLGGSSGLYSQHESRFIGLTRDETNDFFEKQREQLELLTMFELLAIAEAVLRLDVRARVARKKKDSLSRRYRSLHLQRGGRLRLDEDILGALQEEQIVPKSIIRDFRGTLKLRHWLAHGRHWRPNLGRSYTPTDVFDISRRLITAL